MHRWSGETDRLRLMRAATPGRGSAVSARHSIAGIGIQSERIVSRVPALAGLPVSHPDEPAEREAERIAGALQRDSAPPALHARGGTSSDTQTAAEPSRGTERTTALPGRLGAGQPLPAAVRTWFEPRLGVPLDSVRVHAGPDATRIAGAVRARAFTLGEHIVLGEGRARVDGATDRALLGHELVHVLQNRAAGSAQDARRIQRVPIVTNCDRDEQRNIVAAQGTAVRWLAHALARLTRPDEIAAELSFHFRASPRDHATLSSVRVELQQVMADLAADSIAWNCTPATDPACAKPEGGLYAAYADSLGSHSASFCGDEAGTGGNGLATVLLHEALHAKAPGIPDGPYYDDPAYPGVVPSDNADAYTNFVRALGIGILGLAKEPLAPPRRGGSFEIVIGDVQMLGPRAESRVWTVDSFARGTDVIPADGVDLLDDLLDVWQRDFGLTPMTMRVAGHTDGSATSETTSLGQRRADAVANYLLDRLSRRLIPVPVQVQVTSFGSSRPFRSLGPGRTEEPLNRRVQIELRRHRT